MPAAAVTPAPIAYIKVVAVKKLVVRVLSSAEGGFCLHGMSLVPFGCAVSKPCTLNGRTSPSECGYCWKGNRPMRPP